MMIKPTLLLGGIGVALTALLGYNFVYGPFQRQVGLIRLQLAEEQATQQTQGEVAAMLREVEQHRKRLPQDPEPSWLVREVVALSQKAGVQVSAITQEPPSLNEQFTRLAVTLQVSASYHQLGAFLDEVEHSDHFIQVDRVRMNRAQGTGPIAIELTLSTLYLPPIVNVGTPS
jgi:Tfp pilus assembly protein PilO